MNVILVIGLTVLVFALSSCATQTSQRLQADPRLRTAAKEVVKAYLDGQIRGESGRQWGSDSSFYNLQEYRIEMGGQQFGMPVVYVRTKAGNQLGGVTWRDYAVYLKHDPQLEASGDPYLGLRIDHVGESLQRY